MTADPFREAVRRLLECPALNMDDLEPRDLTAIAEVRRLIDLPAVDPTKTLRYAVMAHRGPGSMMGPATKVANHNDKPAIFDTEAEARARAKTWNDGTTSRNVHYTVQPYTD